MGAPAGMFDPLTLPRKGGMLPPGMSDGAAPPGQMQQGIAPALSYKNQYGTDLSAGYDVDTQSVTGRAVIPVGDATDGNRLELRGGYGEGGPSAFIGFKKINVPNLSSVQVAGDAAQVDPEYAQYLEANPGALERVRAAREKQLREAALGINRTGGTAWEIGLDPFGGRTKMAGQGQFSPVMDDVMSQMLGGK